MTEKNPADWAKKFDEDFGVAAFTWNAENGNGLLFAKRKRKQLRAFISSLLASERENAQKEFAIWCNENTSQPTQAVRYVKLGDIVKHYLESAKNI